MSKDLCVKVRSLDTVIQYPCSSSVFSFLLSMILALGASVSAIRLLLSFFLWFSVYAISLCNLEFSTLGWSGCWRITHCLPFNGNEMIWRWSLCLVHIIEKLWIAQWEHMWSLLPAMHCWEVWVTPIHNMGFQSQVSSCMLILGFCPFFH